MSIRGESPPWTHNIAPVSFLLLPFADDVAPVPAAPAREGVGAIGEDEAGLEFGVCEDCESEFRAQRYIISPFALRVSISISASLSGRLSGLVVSARGPSVGEREVAAPVTRAPRAR